MITRRSNRSAKTPPTGAAKIGGTSRRIRTTATAVWFEVRANAAAMNASVATQSPRLETVCPMSSRRKPIDRITPPKPSLVGARRRSDGGDVRNASDGVAGRSSAPAVPAGARSGSLTPITLPFRRATSGTVPG